MKKTVSEDAILIREASEILGVTVHTVLNWINDGKLSATKLPGETAPYILSRAEVVQLAEQRSRDKETRGT